MLRTLIVGLGRSGLGLHLPVLLRARAETAAMHPDHPVVGVDPGYTTRAGQPEDLLVVPSLHRARELLAPEDTVVHLCTPPAVRAEALREVAALGYARIILEKPPAVDRAGLRRILELAREYDLRLSVVAPWLHSTLTGRLAQLLADPSLGAVRTVSVTQHKARFRRSLAGGSHESAFDVELPHATGVLLHLLGDARVSGAGCTDLRVGERTVARMGGARLELLHTSGVRSEVVSDLAAPVRQRRIVLDLAEGRLVGHYAVGQDDDFAQLEITRNGRTEREVLHDDSLTAYMTSAYRHFATDAGRGDGTGRCDDVGQADAGGVGDIGLHVRTVELLDEAKRLAAGIRGAAIPSAFHPDRHKEALSNGS